MITCTSHRALFHSALGLRPGTHSFAEQLRQTGHIVFIPDLYQGEIFEDSGSGELVDCFRSGHMARVPWPNDYKECPETTLYRTLIPFLLI